MNLNIRPPNLLPATVMRFYQTGTATPDQNRYETLLQKWLVGTVLPLLSMPLHNVVLLNGIDNTGSTNVGAALQKVIDDVAAQGETIYLPAGIYLTDGIRIRLPSGTHLVGDGWDRTKIRWTSNTVTAMLECYNVNGVWIEGIGLEYQNASYSLGYGQTGFSIRSGSYNIRLVNCGITGVMNRGFNILNSHNIQIIRPVAIGSGDACLRIVSDHNASGSAGVTDETNMTPVSNILIEGADFSGATTQTGGIRAGTFYGINIATLSDPLDFCSDIMVTNCKVRYTDQQGFSEGGRGDKIIFTGCIAESIGVSPAAGDGVGFFHQKYTGNAIAHVQFIGCTATIVGNGFYVSQSSSCVISGCFAAGCLHAYQLVGAAYCTIQGCQSDNPQSGGTGFTMASSCVNNTVIGCRALTGATGFSTDSTSTPNTFVSCQAISVTTPYSFVGAVTAVANV